MPEKIGPIRPVDNLKKVGDQLFRQHQEQAQQKKKDGEKLNTSNPQITDKVEISRWRK